MTGATRQQRHAVKPEGLNVRISPELIEWIRTYARANNISINMAATQAIEALKENQK